MHTIPRIYNHRKYGEIGRVKLDADVKSMALDGKELPAASIEYLLTFALQSLQDAYAGADNADAAKNAFTAKLAKVIDGTIGTRGQSVSTEQQIAREIMRELFKAKASADDLAAYKNADAAGRNEIIDDRIEANRETMDKLVKAEMERRKATAAKLAEVEVTI